jgi:hypothetical protein
VEENRALSYISRKCGDGPRFSIPYVTHRCAAANSLLYVSKTRRVSRNLDDGVSK